jgi:site-specific DNA-cytosine methylase
MHERRVLQIPRGNPFAALRGTDVIDRVMRRQKHGRLFVSCDFFAGAGGLTSGIIRARDSLSINGHPLLGYHYAVNHDEKAIQTIWSNHHGTFVNSSVSTIPLRDIVKEGYVSLFTGAAECTTHSRAASKDAPVYEQSRTSAAYMLESIRDLPPEAFIIENIREWVGWRSRNARDNAREGKYFLEFIAILRKMGYNVEYRVLNAADYGAHCSRTRVFVIGVAEGRVVWPVPTHAEHPEKFPGLNLKPWQPARDIIDWSDLGESIFTRESPHAPKSLRRTKTGFTEQGTPSALAYAKAIEQFMPISEVFHFTRAPKFEFTREDWKRNKSGLDPYTGEIKKNKTVCPYTLRERRYVSNVWRAMYDLPHADGELTKKERATILQLARAQAREATKHAFRAPTAIFTVDENDDVAAFVIANRTNSQGRDVRYEPLHTISTATGGGVRLATPTSFIYGQHGGATPRDPREHPMPSPATKGAIGLVQPMLNQTYENPKPADIEQPVCSPTAAVQKIGLIQPKLMRMNASDTNHYDDAVRDVDRPLESPTQKLCIGPAAEPFGVTINNGGDDDRVHDLSTPCPSPTSRGFFALVRPEGFITRQQGFYGDADSTRAIEQLDEPISSPSAGGKHHLLVNPGEPFLLKQHTFDDDGIASVDKPIPSPTTISRNGVVRGVMQDTDAVIVSRCSDHNGDGRLSNRTSSPDEVLPNCTASGAGYLANPLIIQNFGERNGQKPRYRDLDKPLYTVCPQKGAGVLMLPHTANPDNECKPWIVVNGTAIGIDILFRMLRWRELARAMGFITKKHSYTFAADTEQDIVRMIGNAVSVEQSYALALEVIKAKILPKIHAVVSAKEAA